MVVVLCAQRSLVVLLCSYERLPVAVLREAIYFRIPR